MKSMMRKTTLREIRQSFGRYSAILAIVALGVGFFSGLKVTKDAMMVSTEEYLQKHQLFDYRLLSTLGFEEEDVEALSQKEDVRAVTGAMSADIICENAQGSDMVIKAHSLTDNINGVEVLAGRMPQSADECVVDSNLFSESAVGSKIVLSESNEQEDLDNFAYREYTITGIVQSSYYIQFERGNTSLGNGRISGFIYLLPEGFRMEYYTEIFVKFDEDYGIYTEDYNAFMEEKEAPWESYCEEQGERRYQKIYTEAMEELTDAERELDEKRAEAEAELKDAEKELTDAEEEIADGEKKLADGEKKIKDGERELEEGAQEIADAEVTIAEKEKELEEGKLTIADNEALLETKKAEYESGLSAYYSGKAQIEQKRQELAAADAQIKAAEAELQKAQEQLAAMEPYIPYMKPEELAAYEQAKAELEANARVLSEKKAQIAGGLAQLNEADSQLNNAYAQLQSGAWQIADAENKIAAAKQQITDGEAELANAKTELAEAKTELENGRSELEKSKSEIADKKQELLDAKEELENGWAEYHDALAEFEEEIANAEEELEEAREDIASIKKPDTYVLGRNTNIGYACFENDSNIVEGIANVFPVFFFLVAALVCMTTMNRMVEEQRTQIGVLKALGYGEGRIMGKFLFYSGSAALIGSVTGFLLGTRLFPLVIWNAYGIMYSMGSLAYLFDWKLAVISLVVALLCSMGTTWFSCRYEMKEVAAGLMRPKAPKAGKRVFLEYVPFIWKRLKFLQKVSVRNVVRYKKRFFMMIIGISGCTALLLTGFGIEDSIADIAAQQFGEIQVYALGVTLQDGKTGTADGKVQPVLESLDALGGSYLFSYEKSLDLEVNGQIKAINLILVEQPERIGEFIDLHTADGKAVAYPGVGEVVLSNKIADIYGIREGDTILLRDENRKTIEAAVSGIVQNFVYDYAYLHPQTYREQIGEVEYKNLYVNLPEETDVHMVSASLMKEDNVAAVAVNEDTMFRFSSMMDSLDYIVLVVLLCAAALAFIVLYNLNNINITERVREIATIKVLGFYKKETAAYVFRENMVLTGVGCCVGLVLGRFLHAFVMSQIKIDVVSFDVRIKVISYLFSVILTFLFAWLINLLMSRKLEKISMTESLKSVD